MVGLASDKASKFRDFLKKYLMAILNVDELFAGWLSSNLHHLTDTSAELIDAPDSFNLDLVRCSAVCKINSATELRTFKLIVKSIAPLNKERRAVIESAIRKTLEEDRRVTLKLFKECISLVHKSELGKKENRDLLKDKEFSEWPGQS